VAVKRSDDHQGFIHAVLPRKSIFSRKVAGLVLQEQIIATNIDYAWVVVACDQSFRLRSIERYITQCHRSGAKPVLVMNKAELIEDHEQWLNQRSIIDPSIPVHWVSARNKQGLDSLSPYLRKGVTSTLVGSSGVGKSSLVNAIISEDLMKTGEVRAYDHKGKHTTTKREMIVLPKGGMIIDNPGMREIQLWADEANLDQSFSDIDGYAKQCKYANCTHGSEPECAVREALEKGEISVSRWENYQKMLREVRYLEKRKKGKIR
jgi:ribosome biogenesis GTPase